MYESFFGLNRRPFCFAPAVDRYFPVASSDAARQALVRCIDRAEGVGLLVAAPGMGKSLVLQVLADQFRDRFPVVQLGTGQIETRRELLQSFAHDLRVPFRGMDDGELRLAVTSFLTSDDRCPQGILILADEAHTLSFSILDELRMLTNVVKEGESRVRLVLAGNMRLEEQLTDPRLESLSQRIVCRRYLERFDSSETAEYIRFQVAAAGGQVERVFEQAAQDAVFQASDGIPRLINQLCDFALLTAYSDDEQPITAAGIAAAWAELQQLPGQFVDPPGPPKLRVSSGDDDVIEYGGLSDDAYDDDIDADNINGHDDTITLHGKANVPSLLRVSDEVDEDNSHDSDSRYEDSQFEDSSLENDADDESFAVTTDTDDDVADNTQHTSSYSLVDPEQSDDDAEADDASQDREHAAAPQATEERAEQNFEHIEGQLNDVIQQHASQPSVGRYRITPAEDPINQDEDEVDSETPSKPVVESETGTTDAAAPEALIVADSRAESAPSDAKGYAIVEEFSDEFDEEEVVVDHYARLEASVRKHKPLSPPARHSSPSPSGNSEQQEADTTGQSASQEEISTTPPSQQQTEPAARSDIQIEENEDRLQVFVNPYGDLYDDDDDLEDTDEFIESSHDEADDESSDARDPIEASDAAADAANRADDASSDDDVAVTSKQETPSATSILSQLALSEPDDTHETPVTPASPTSSSSTGQDATAAAKPSMKMSSPPTAPEMIAPPMALPAPARALTDAEAETDEEQIEEMIRPFMHKATDHEAEEIDAPRPNPILIIEDDDEDDLDEITDLHADAAGHATTAGHNVRMEDYTSLFARLRGDQQSSE